MSKSRIQSISSPIILPPREQGKNMIYVEQATIKAISSQFTNKQMEQMGIVSRGHDGRCNRYFLLLGNTQNDAQLYDTAFAYSQCGQLEMHYCSDNADKLPSSSTQPIVPAMNSSTPSLRNTTSVPNFFSKVESDHNKLSTIPEENETISMKNHRITRKRIMTAPPPTEKVESVPQSPKNPISSLSTAALPPVNSNNIPFMNSSEMIPPSSLNTGSAFFSPLNHVSLQSEIVKPKKRQAEREGGEIDDNTYRNGLNKKKC